MKCGKVAFRGRQRRRLGEQNTRVPENETRKKERMKGGSGGGTGKRGWAGDTFFKTLKPSSGNGGERAQVNLPFVLKVMLRQGQGEAGMN